MRSTRRPPRSPTGAIRFPPGVSTECEVIIVRDRGQQRKRSGPRRFFINSQFTTAAGAKVSERRVRDRRGRAKLGNGDGGSPAVSEVRRDGCSLGISAAYPS